MKRKKLSVAILLDSWFPEFGGQQVHVNNLKTKLHQHFNTETELFYLGRKDILFKAIWPIALIFQIIKVHKDKPFDLIHSHGVMAGIPAKIVSLWLKIPVIHTVHGSPHLDQSKKLPMYYLESWILTKIKYDYQISVSDKFTKHKNKNKHIAVIPNGVDIVAFNKIKVRKNKNPQLIWVGKDIPEKGVDYLKEAINRVRKTIPKLETELVTGGRLIGEDLIRAYKRSHVFVLSSLAEGQPITLLEAWAARLPVVVTDVGDNSKLIENGKNGILVEPENINQLSRAILKVIRSKTTGKRMGLEGYKTVKKHFSWLNVAKDTYAIYKKALKIYEKK